MSSSSSAAARSTAVVWLRVGDLRVADNPALVEAAANHANVVPLFVFDPKWFSVGRFGMPKMGCYRAKFLLESLVDLRKVRLSEASC